MRWLSECSVGAVREALRVGAPALPDGPVVLRGRPDGGDPLWHSGSATLAGRYVVKFAWSARAAARLAHEIAVLDALRGRVPFLPVVAAATTGPVLLVTERVAGDSLFRATVEPERAGADLAGFLAALHHRDLAGHVATFLGAFPVPPGYAADTAPWPRIEPWLPPARRAVVRGWLTRADAVLAEPAATVLVHGDLHGDNQVWVDGRLRLVLDFESTWLADPEYDLRAVPGALLDATLRHYAHATGAPLSRDRVRAWRLRAALADITWRGEAGIGLPDGRAVDDWLDELARTAGR